MIREAVHIELARWKETPDSILLNNFEDSEKGPWLVYMFTCQCNKKYVGKTKTKNFVKRQNDHSYQFDTHFNAKRIIDHLCIYSSKSFKFEILVPDIQTYDRCIVEESIQIELERDDNLLNYFINFDNLSH